MSPYYYRRSLDWWMMNKFTQSPIRARDIDVKIFSLIWLSYFKIQFIVHVWNKVKMIEWKFVLDFLFFNLNFRAKFQNLILTISLKFKTEKKCFGMKIQRDFWGFFPQLFEFLLQKMSKLNFALWSRKKFNKSKLSYRVYRNDVMII